MEIKYIPMFQSIDMAERKIPILIQRSKNPGPVIWLIGATHGDEVNGIPVIHRIFNYLKREPLKCGTVYGMPILNILGFEFRSREHPYNWEDMNRMFPGDTSGSTAERTAALVYKTIIETKPSLVIDMHCDVPDAIPYILVDRPISSATNVKQTVEKSWRFADKFGITVTYDPETEGYRKYKLDKTLSASLINRAGIPAFVVEVGGPNALTEKFIRIGTGGVKNILDELGMIDLDEPRYSHPSKIKTQKRLEQLKEITSSKSGLIEYKVEPGDKVKKGDVLVEITNVLAQTVEEIRAPKDCYIVSLADRAISYPGSQLISSAAEE